MLVIRNLLLFQTDWLHHYEACGEYAHKMTPDDFLEFIFAVTFSDSVISQVCSKSLFQSSLSLLSRHLFSPAESSVVIVSLRVCVWGVIFYV